MKELDTATIKYIGDTESYWDMFSNVIALSVREMDEELLESMAVHEITEVTLASICEELREDVLKKWDFFGMASLCGTHILTILGQEGTYRYHPHIWQIEQWKEMEREKKYNKRLARWVGERRNE